MNKLVGLSTEFTEDDSMLNPLVTSKELNLFNVTILLFKSATYRLSGPTDKP